MKKVFAVILALTLALTSLSVLASAVQYDEKIPCIIVPGIGQSRVWLVDENGDFVLNNEGEKIDCFPAVLDIKTMLLNLAAPLAASVAAQRDIGLSDALAKEIKNAFYMNSTDDNAVPSDRVVVEEYPHSIAECTQDEKEFIFSCVPTERLCDTLGEENIYYYAYNSFGNALDMIDGLYDYIQLVKEQTGSKKVNIVPISMGGAIFNGLMDLYPEVCGDLHRIIFVIPALNGSKIVSDILERELTFLNEEYLYSDFFDGFLSESDASTIELAIRVLPKNVLMTCINAAVDTIMETTVTNCTGLWMLVPYEEYDRCVEMNLADDSKAEVRRQTDIFHKAQGNSKKNITAFKNSGVEIFDIVDYDLPLYNFGNSWDKENADGIIQASSTSIGAYMANVGESLPENYVQKNTYCKNSKHNHISPDKVVDASTGLLPDTTFYFEEQSHAYTNENDIIMRLCCELVESDRITSVYSDPAFPQFNVGRETLELREKLLPAAYGVDRSTLSAEDAKELDESVAAAEAMLSRTIAVKGEAPEIESRLRAILEKINAVEPKSGDSALSPVVKKISDYLFAIGGANGYTDIGKDIIDGIINGNGDGDGENPTVPPENGDDENVPNGETGGENAGNGVSGGADVSGTPPLTDRNLINVSVLMICLAASGAVFVAAIVVFRKKREDA